MNALWREESPPEASLEATIGKQRVTSDKRGGGKDAEAGDKKLQSKKSQKVTQRVWGPPIYKGLRT